MLTSLARKETSHQFHMAKSTLSANLSRHLETFGIHGRTSRVRSCSSPSKGSTVKVISSDVHLETLAFNKVLEEVNNDT